MIEDIERLNGSVKRLNEALEASRENERRAREERDEALSKIAKVAEYLYRPGPCFCEDIEQIIDVCPLCGILGRLADAPCTHKSSQPREGRHTIGS